MLGRALLVFSRLLFFVELRLRGVVCPSPMVLRGKPPRVRNAGTMRVGRDVRVHGRVTRVQLGSAASGRLVLGDSVGINEV